MRSSTASDFIARSRVACVALVLLCSCTTPPPDQARPSSVRKVDFSAAQEYEAFAGHVRKVGNQMYPQVCALLSDGKTSFPLHFDVWLKPKLPKGNPGETRMSGIFLDTSYLKNGEDDLRYFDHVLIHELAHVAQHYSRPIVGSWVVYTSRPPNCWQEGIADYVYFKLCETNDQPCGCGLRFPHYLSGYSCAAAFLLYLENTYSSNVVRQLNAVLRRGDYSDEFFLKTTGKKLPDLWAEFQQTSAFTLNAARMLELQKTLGYVDGKPPKDIVSRFQSFINQATNAATKEMLRLSSLSFLKKGHETTGLAAFLYFSQPGGTPETYVISLQQENRLPGIDNAQETELSSRLKLSDMDPKYPCARNFTATRRGDPFTYHYAVFSPSPNADWKLQRAWRTSPDGALLEEYSVP
jgi:Peptidase of plants and bacteria